MNGRIIRSETLNVATAASGSGALSIDRGDIGIGSYILTIISEGQAFELPLLIE